MRSCVFVALIVAMAFSARAANVWWDFAILEYEYGAGTFEDPAFYMLFAPSHDMWASSDGTTLSFWADPSSYVHFDIALDKANKGDFVDQSFVDAHDTHFFKADRTLPYGTAIADYSIAITGNESVYLAGVYSPWDNPSRVLSEWIELGIGSDGMLEVRHSALNRTAGEGLIVGAIPEPSSGVLLLLGLGLMGLRRRL